MELQPGLDAARLQLALLQLVCGHADVAQSTLMPLSVTEREDFYGEFARGFTDAIAGRLVPAAQALERGIELNDLDSGLNAQVAEVLAVLLQLIPAARGEEAPDDHALRRALLAGYEQTDGSSD